MRMLLMAIYQYLVPDMKIRIYAKRSQAASPASSPHKMTITHLIDIAMREVPSDRPLIIAMIFLRYFLLKLPPAPSITSLYLPPIFSTRRRRNNMILIGSPRSAHAEAFTPLSISWRHELIARFISPRQLRLRRRCALYDFAPGGRGPRMMQPRLARTYNKI